MGERTLGDPFLSKTRLPVGEYSGEIPAAEKYWTVPERQIDTSVVLADARWQETLR